MLRYELSSIAKLARWIRKLVATESEVNELSPTESELACSFNFIAELIEFEFEAKLVLLSLRLLTE